MASEGDLPSGPEDLWSLASTTACHRVHRIVSRSKFEVEPSHSQTDFLVGLVTELPDLEVDAIVSDCSLLFENAMLGSLAVPEVLERHQTAGVSSYDDVCRRGASFSLLV